jgi:hypothetical protein
VALAEAGKIGREELAAALLWRGWYEAIGRMRTQRWIMRVDGEVRSGSGMAEYQLTAADRLRRAAEALGPARVALLQWVIVEEMTWRDIAARLSLCPKTTVKRAVEAIAALALWRAGEPVPPAPVTRQRIEPGRW